MTITRRAFTISLGAAVGAASIPHAGFGATEDGFTTTVRDIEKELGGRLGVYVWDTHSQREWAYRANERFPLTSTFKAFACGGVLSRVDAGKEKPDRIVRFGKESLVDYSPVTEKHADGAGMALSEICRAAMELSDNSAGNMVLDALGGPGGFTVFMRVIGDTETRLDRRETALNEASPGDVRDTTTPRAAASSLQRLVLGDALSAASRSRLQSWLIGNRVGGPLLRAGLPEDWRIGDRTGAGGHGSRAIVAVMWPPKRKPVIAAIYMTGNDKPMDARNAAIARIGRVLAETIMG